MDFALLKKLTEAPGVSGREAPVRAEIIKLLKPLTDEIKTDALGNVIAFKKGAGKKTLILCSHMDEVGFMVNFIDKDGFLRVLPMGGIDPATLPASRVVVHSSKGPIAGVFGVKAAHLVAASGGDGTKVQPIKSLFIDIGMTKEEADKVIPPGTVVSFDTETIEFGDGLVMAKALDCRAGVYTIIQTLKNLKNQEVNIYAVITSQEEVGTRGAGPGLFGIEADMAVVIDPTGASDIPGVNPQDYNSTVKKGVVINVVDRETVSNPLMVDAMAKLAVENKIKHQFRITNVGGNDAKEVHKSRTGLHTVAVAVPNRNIHSANAVSAKEDIDAAVALVTQFVENCHKFKFDL